MLSPAREALRFEFLWKNVDKRGPDECWLYCGSRKFSSTLRPQMHWERTPERHIRKVLTHVVLYQLTGKWPTYVEHSYGTFHGREQIRNWIVKTMNGFPGSEMPFYPSTWHSIDEEKGWVICEFQNRMRDPGDGSIHQAPNISVLKYAGDGLWSYEEDAYNPMNFVPMVRGYIDRCRSLGTISDDAVEFARKMRWEPA